LPSAKSRLALASIVVVTCDPVVRCPGTVALPVPCGDVYGDPAAYPWLAGLLRPICVPSIPPRSPYPGEECTANGVRDLQPENVTVHTIREEFLRGLAPGTPTDDRVVLDRSEVVGGVAHEVTTSSASSSAKVERLTIT
jgi:hypothetical protein